MAANLDTLIEEARLEGVSESQLGRRGTRIDYDDPMRPKGKPVPPEPDEPPLVAPTAPFVGGNFARRMEQRHQATQRRLNFARALVSSGWDGVKALAAAGYSPSPKAVKSAIAALSNHPDVIAEVQRLRLVLEQKADVATIDLAKEWVGIAKSNVFDLFHESAPGHLTLKGKSELPKDVQRAVKAIKIRRKRYKQKDETEVETEDIEVVLWDKQAALDSLAKIQGLYADKTADAIDNLALKIAQRTERHRKKVGQTFDAKALEVDG